MRVVAAESTAGVAGVDENHLTGSQGVMSVSNSMSSWNSLPSRTEHDEVAVAAGDGDAHKHSSMKTTEAEKVLLFLRTQYLKMWEEEVHGWKARMKKRKEEEDHMRNDDAAANYCYDLRANHDSDPN